MQSVIITGSTGTIGAALADYLSTRAVRVYAVCRPESKRINAVKNKKNICVIECDISDISSITQYISEEVDVFYHLGWDGTSKEKRNNCEEQEKNIKYILDAVDVAKALNCQTFIGAGSQAEYGRHEGILTPKTFTNPESAYGCTKLYAGQVSRILCRQYNIKHIWARFLSVYGPYNGDDSMIISVINDFLNYRSPQCTPGEQVWDYMFSVDAAKALYLLGEKGISGKTYCIGNGTGMSIQDYILKIRDCIGSTQDIEFGAIPYSENQIMKLIADISDLTNDTGFTPEYTFEKGIAETISWIKQQHKQESN